MTSKPILPGRPAAPIRIFAALAVLAASALAPSRATAGAAAFSDVPLTHWAREAVERAVAAGVLQGWEGRFHGEQLLNRYQVAVVVTRILDAVAKGLPAVATAAEDTRARQDQSARLASGIADLQARCVRLDAVAEGIRSDLAELRAARSGRRHRRH